MPKVPVGQLQGSTGEVSRRRRDRPSDAFVKSVAGPASLLTSEPWLLRSGLSKPLSHTDPLWTLKGARSGWVSLAVRHFPSRRVRRG